jgi:uncharacterized cupin superfamily protein
MKITHRVAAALDRRARRWRGQPPRSPDVAVQTFAVHAAELADGVRDEGSPTDGSPVSRWWRPITSEDGGIESGIWDSTSGRHDITFDFDEWVHILEGEVDVTVGAVKRTLRAGDVAFFHAGVHMVWDVHRYVRKLWVQRHRRPGLVTRAARRVGAIVRRRGRA